VAVILILATKIHKETQSKKDETNGKD